MALSDYERRVLDEIESEFTHAPRRRLNVLRRMAFAMRWAALITCALVGLVIGLAFVLPLAGAVALASCACAVAGFLLGATWCRCRFWLRGR